MAAPKATQFSAAFPSAPLLDDITGLLTPAWRGFFRALWARTGDADGVDLDAIIQSLTEADNGLSTRDDQLAASILAETVARRVADSTEATTRAAEDTATRAAMLPLSGGTLTGPLEGPLGSFGVVQTGGAAGPEWTAGAGPPGTAVAPIGSLYSNISGAVGATLYVSRGGGTWLPVAGV
jgi:hypothetical protein